MKNENRYSYAIDIIDTLLSNLDNIYEFSILSYTPTHPVSKRISLLNDQVFHETYDYRFARNLSAADIEIISANMMNTDNNDDLTKIKWIKRTDLTDFLRDLNANTTIGISSLCRLYDNKEVHIYMMDFACPKSDQNQNIIIKLLSHVEHKGGILVDSGNSYHYYSLDTISKTEWHNKMIQSILMQPFADSRYIAHRLQNDIGVLRINANASKNYKPRIIKLIEFDR